MRHHSNIDFLTRSVVESVHALFKKRTMHGGSKKSKRHGSKSKRHGSKSKRHGAKRRCKSVRR